MIDFKEIERIKERWNPSDNMGIGHPIWEPDLSSDVAYLAALVPKELKHKREVPTVIEYQGRRYVLDYGTRN